MVAGLSWTQLSVWSQSLHMVLPTEELNCFHSCPGIQESIPWTRSRSCQCLRACPRSSNSILSTIFCWTVQSGSTQTQSTPNLSYWVQPRKLHIPTKWPLWNQVGSDLYWVIKVLNYPLQYSCLQNPLDRGACQATVHGVKKSQPWLSMNTPILLWPPPR